MRPITRPRRARSSGRRTPWGASSFSFWTARTGFIAKNRAALTDLLEDYVRAYHWYLDPAHRDEAIAIAANFTKVPPAAFQSWLFTPEKDFYRDPNAVPDIGAMTRNIHAQHELGLIKADLDAKAYADLGPLRAAIARVK